MLIAAGAQGYALTQRDAQPVSVGDVFPDVLLAPLFDGEPAQSTHDLRGKVAIVDLWVSWCTPCKREIPELSKVYEDYRDRGATVLGVNREPRNRTAARKTWTELAPSFRSVVVRDAGRRSGLGETLGGESLPTTYVLDRDGVVSHVHIGYTAPDDFRSELDSLLAE